MSLWSRIANVFRGDRLNREIDEELESHVEAAIEQGRDPAEARRAFDSSRGSSPSAPTPLSACVNCARTR